MGLLFLGFCPDWHKTPDILSLVCEQSSNNLKKFLPVACHFCCNISLITWHVLTNDAICVKEAGLGNK